MLVPRLIIEKEILENLINKCYSPKNMIEELHIARETLVKLLKENDLKIKGKPDELIGKTFGKLTVVERLENSKDRRKVYRCKCECGNTTDVNLSICIRVILEAVDVTKRIFIITKSKTTKKHYKK